MSRPGDLPDWPRALGTPGVEARVRAAPEDFRVDELRDGEPAGEGEHLLLHLRKRNRNTEEVARALARCAGVRPRDVSYCGLKDRVAVTSQWFSVWLPGRPDPDWSPVLDGDLELLAQVRDRRKLQRGALRGNRFTLVLRALRGDLEGLERRLERVRAEGVPNYFGEQRFGRAGSNLSGAAALFAGRRYRDRHRRGLYLSAARSLLFNEVLGARVRAGSWRRALPGEALMLAGSRSFFVADEIDPALLARLDEGDIAPSGPLWGRGEPPCRGEARSVELAALAGHAAFREGLERAGLRQERRALHLPVGDLHWTWQGDDLRLAFELGPGSYATAVLRELVLARRDEREAPA